MVAYRRMKSWLCLIALAAAAGCSAPPSTTSPPTTPAGPVVKRDAFGSAAGQPVEQLTLTNKNGVEVRAITYGGIITSITTPDRNGAMADRINAGGPPRNTVTGSGSLRASATA